MRLSDKLTVFAVAAALVALVVFFVITHHHHPQPAPKPPESGRLIARTGYYFGVSEANEIASYRPVNRFAAAVGRQPNVVLYFSAWGDPFYIRLADAAHAHHAVPFVQINPGRVPMAAVAAGREDRYLRSYARQVRAWRHPVIIGFAAEMNGSWDPWGYRHTPPSAWIAAWRHVVTVFRQQGAINATWLWTVNAKSKGSGPIRDWWPGPGYVDWVGIDGYYFFEGSTFASVFGPTLNEVRALTSKPVLLSETGIGQIAGPSKIPDLFAGIRAAQAVGFVWFDRAQHNGIFHQHWRLEDRPAALEEFRRALKEY
jgi:mannan endo-1,4-beta-mannosidase